MRSRPIRSLVRSSSSTSGAGKKMVEHENRSLGLPTTLSCPDAAFEKGGAAASSSLFNITVTFFYELAVFDPYEPLSEVLQDVSMFEFSVLVLVAKAIKMRPCSIGSQPLTNSRAAVTSLMSIEPDTLDESVCEYKRC